METKKNVLICPYAKKCGGCGGFVTEYNKQLENKQKEMKCLFEGICPVHEIAGMYYPYHYRNKVHRVFGLDKKGKPVYGMYAAGTHEIIPVADCLIEDKLSQKIIDTIWSLLPSFKIKTFDEDSGRGFLRHVLVRRGFSTGQVMVIIVTADITWPGAKNFVKVLKEKHPEITTIVQSVNDKKTTFVLGDRFKTLFGPGYIQDKLMGLTFLISPASFYQINPKQTEVLYKLAIHAAELKGNETVLDAYCGIGTIGMAAADAGAGRVLGVELNQDAVRDARTNAAKNSMKNISFTAEDAAVWMKKAAAQGETPDIVFMDPPRSGSTAEFIEAVYKMGPEKVVYVSCNPETQVRDIKMFMKKGYQPSACWPVDQFPGTDHVESVLLLTKVHK